MTELEDIDSAPHGADAYLVKPIEMRELDVRVQNLIAARQRLPSVRTVPTYSGVSRISVVASMHSTG